MRKHFNDVWYLRDPWVFCVFIFPFLPKSREYEWKKLKVEKLVFCLKKRAHFFSQQSQKWYRQFANVRDSKLYCCLKYLLPPFAFFKWALKSHCFEYETGMMKTILGGLKVAKQTPEYVLQFDRFFASPKNVQFLSILGGLF